MLTNGMVDEVLSFNINQYINEIVSDDSRKNKKKRKGKTGSRHTKKAKSPFPIHPVQVLPLPNRSHRIPTTVLIPQTANSIKFSSILSANIVVPDSARQILH